MTPHCMKKRRGQIENDLGASWEGQFLVEMLVWADFAHFFTRERPAPTSGNQPQRDDYAGITLRICCILKRAVPLGDTK